MSRRFELVGIVFLSMAAVFLAGPRSAPAMEPDWDVWGPGTFETDGWSDFHCQEHDRYAAYINGVTTFTGIGSVWLNLYDKWDSYMWDDHYHLIHRVVNDTPFDWTGYQITLTPNEPLIVFEAMPKLVDVPFTNVDISSDGYTMTFSGGVVPYAASGDGQPFFDVVYYVEVPQNKTNIVIEQSVLALRRLYWDEQGNGEWGETTDNGSRWIGPGGHRAGMYPNDSQTQAVIHGNTVTVTADRTAASLSVTEATVSVAGHRTLRLINSVEFGEGATLELWQGAQLYAGNEEGTLHSVVSGPGVTIHGDVTLEGTLTPGYETETLVVDGRLTMAESSVYVCDIGAGGTDLIIADSAVIEDGSTVDFRVSGASPFSAGHYTILNAGDLRGQFTSYVGLGKYLSDDRLWYDECNAGLTIEHDLLPGDADLSMATDLSDFNLWNAHKFTEGTDWTSGDFNGDGQTDLSDFNIWNEAKFSIAAGGPATYVAAPVPEPGVLALFGAAVVCLLASYRRRCCR